MVLGRKDANDERKYDKWSFESFYNYGKSDFITKKTMEYIEEVKPFLTWFIDCSLI